LCAFYHARQAPRNEPRAVNIVTFVPTAAILAVINPKFAFTFQLLKVSKPLAAEAPFG